MHHSVYKLRFPGFRNLAVIALAVTYCIRYLNNMINIPASKRLSGVWRRTALAWLAVCSISCAADIVNVQSYDWFDNGKSAGIAFPKSDGNPTVHNQATQGTGTYTDPGTFAASKKDFPVGSFIYIPVFQKYFVRHSLPVAFAYCDINGLTPT